MDETAPSPSLLHPAADFMADGRPLFPAHMRSLAPELARVAVFVIKIGPGPAEDRREPQEKLIAGCESSRCAIRTNSGELSKDAPQ